MDIMEMGAIGEAIGGVAVIATLVYLAMGIRRNTASVNTALFESITSGLNNINAIVIGEAELADQFNRAMSDPEELTLQQQARLGGLIRMYHNQYNKLFYLYRAGLLSEVQWADYAAQWAQLIATPGGTAYLRGNTDNPELTDAVRPYEGHSTFSFDIPIGR